jgi:hypothetical protein
MLLFTNIFFLSFFLDFFSKYLFCIWIQRAQAPTRGEFFYHFPRPRNNTYKWKYLSTFGTICFKEEITSGEISKRSISLSEGVTILSKIIKINERVKKERVEKRERKIRNKIKQQERWQKGESER